MAKNMLKSYGRFELLELIYNMRKENLELNGLKVMPSTSWMLMPSFRNAKEDLTQSG